MLGDWMGCQQHGMEDGTLFSHKPRCVRKADRNKQQRCGFPKIINNWSCHFCWYIFIIFDTDDTEKKGSPFPGCQVDRFTRVESQGVWGIVEGQVVGAGSKRFLDSMAIDLPSEAEEQVGWDKKITGFLGSWTWQLDFIIWAVFKTPVGWWLYRELYYPIYWGFWTPLMCLQLILLRACLNCMWWVVNDGHQSQPESTFPLNLKFLTVEFQQIAHMSGKVKKWEQEGGVFTVVYMTMEDGWQVSVPALATSRGLFMPVKVHHWYSLVWSKFMSLNFNIRKLTKTPRSVGWLLDDWRSSPSLAGFTGDWNMICCDLDTTGIDIGYPLLN